MVMMMINFNPVPLMHANDYDVLLRGYTSPPRPPKPQKGNIASVY